MTQDGIIEMARQAGISKDHAQGMTLFLKAFAKLVAEKEREACAKECWKQMGMIPMQPWTVNPYEECAKAIRARGYQKGQTD